MSDSGEFQPHFHIPCEAEEFANTRTGEVWQLGRGGSQVPAPGCPPLLPGLHLGALPGLLSLQLRSLGDLLAGLRPGLHWILGQQSLVLFNLFYSLNFTN